MPRLSGIRAWGENDVQLEGRQHGHHVRGHDPAQPVSRVAGQPRRRVIGGRGDNPRAKQQEAGKHEEERDTDFETCVDGAEVSVGELAGGERRMCSDDEERGDGPHAGQGGVAVVVFDESLGRRLAVMSYLGAPRCSAPQGWLARRRV